MRVGGFVEVSFCGKTSCFRKVAKFPRRNLGVSEHSAGAPRLLMSLSHPSVAVPHEVRAPPHLRALVREYAQCVAVRFPNVCDPERGIGLHVRGMTSTFRFAQCPTPVAPGGGGQTKMQKEGRERSWCRWSEQVPTYAYGGALSAVRAQCNYLGI